MAKIDFKQESTCHFIGDNFLRVPVYQRSFAWEKENVKELFDDIKNSYPNEYFIGTIVINKKEDDYYFEIVDGQQRLATISIFYIAARDFLEEKEEKRKADAIEKEYILKQSYREDDIKQRLKLNSIDDCFYFDTLIKRQTNNPTKSSHKRLKETYDFLKEYIRKKYENDGIDGLLDLLDFLKDKLLIIVVMVNDDVNAFTVFETLNDRGLILSQTITFLKNLDENSLIYIALTNPTHQLWKNFPKECSEYISELLELKLSQNRPLLLALLINWKEKPDELRKALKIIVSWSVRNLITGSIGSGTLEQEFSNQAKLISEGIISDSRALLESVKKFIPTDEDFKKAFEIVSVSKAYLARFYLKKLELSFRSTSELVPRATLEHILPENPLNLAADWPEFDENTHRSFFKRIGNLTLLDRDMNNSIGNGNFVGKSEVYRNSEIVITKTIAEKYTRWTSIEIEQRQKELTEKALEVWNLII
jgi:hypothetical protein